MMPVYKVRVPYGRGEMTAEYLVAAYTPVKALRLADKATPVPAPKSAITCYLIPKLAYDTKEPIIIEKL